MSVYFFRLSSFVIFGRFPVAEFLWPNPLFPFLLLLDFSSGFFCHAGSVFELVAKNVDLLVR